MAWTTEFTEERVLLSIELDGSLPTELSGARRLFGSGATAPGDGGRGCGGCLGGGGGVGATERGSPLEKAWLAQGEGESLLGGNGGGPCGRMLIAGG